MRALEWRFNETPSRLNIGGISKRRPRRLDLSERRVRVYDDVFGAHDHVYCEQAELTPHIDVYRFPPTAERPFFTFVTAGMSDLAMHSPAELEARYRRVELLFYAAEGKTEYMEMLNAVARFPHDNATWLQWGHMVTSEPRARPLLQSGTQNCLFLLPSPVETDSRLGDYLSWEGEPIQLLWCVPISMAECSFQRERGGLALCELFRARSHPFVYAGDRESYV
jgi:hypothetical protein